MTPEPSRDDLKLDRWQDLTLPCRLIDAGLRVGDRGRLSDDPTVAHSCAGVEIGTPFTVVAFGDGSPLIKFDNEPVSHPCGGWLASIATLIEILAPAAVAESPSP